MAFTNWMNRSIRNGGEWNSGNFTIPAGIESVNIELNLLQNSDFATPDKSITLSVEVSNDGATTWVEQMTVGWVGGTPPGRSGKWYASINGIGEFAGFLARVHISQSGSFRYGIRGEIA
jgi:hypothetical protein